MKISESKIALMRCAVLLVIGVPLAFGIEWAKEKREAEESHVLGGIHDVILPETVIIKDINRLKREITVEMVDRDNIYIHEGEANPYDKDEIIIEYSYHKDYYISYLKVSDEVVFKHFYDTPYKLESIGNIEELAKKRQAEEEMETEEDYE